MKLQSNTLGVFCVLLCSALLLNCGNGGSNSTHSTLNQIVVTPASKSIPKGTSLSLTATGMYSDGSERNLTAVVAWVISSPAVAKMNAQGSLSALAVGTTQVSAAFEEFTGSASITVGEAALTSISIGVPEASLPEGESEALTATGTYTDGSTQNLTAMVTWQAGPTNVATVSTQGSLKGLNTGAAQVSAAYQSVTGNAAITVASPALLGITVAAPRATLPSGESESLTATGTFSNGSTQNLTGMVTWLAGPSNVASVNAQGNLKGLNTGVAQISAAYQNVTGNAAVNIGSAALVGIAVSAPRSSLPLGESEALTATGSFSDGTTQDLTGVVTWQVGPTSVGSINAQGNLSARGQGVAQISASYQSLNGTAAVTVAAPALLQISVTPSSASLPLGESQSLVATGSFSDGSTQNLTAVASWSSSLPSVATLASAGSVTAKAQGSAIISAAVGPVNGAASLTVTAPVIVGVSITPAQSSLFIGSTTQLLATASYSDGSSQNVSSTATWISEEPSIVGASSGGNVTAVQVGSATVQAADGGFTGSATLTVTPMVLISYFTRVNSVNSKVDGTLYIVDPGLTQTDMCAMIYLFDQNQEMNECCGCEISDNGLLTISLLKNLTAAPLTGRLPNAGDIEIIPANLGPGGTCNAGSPVPNSTLAAWETNVQGAKGSYQLTETPATVDVLTSTEEQVLANECSMIQNLGSGTGICSCGIGD
jgi:trimeric autotransporter adhesin